MGRQATQGESPTHSRGHCAGAWRALAVFIVVSGCADPTAAPTGNPWDASPISNSAPPVPVVPSTHLSAGGGPASPTTSLEAPAVPAGRAPSGTATPTKSGAPVAAAPPLPASQKSPLVGRGAPDVDLRYLSGGEFNLAAFRDKQIVVLAFWSIAQPESVAALKPLDALAKEFRERGVLTAAVNVGDPYDGVRAFVGKSEFDFPIPHDVSHQASIAFQARELPTVVVIDREGIVQAVHTGSESGFDAELRGQLEAIISGKGLGPEKRPMRVIVVEEPQK